MRIDGHAGRTQRRRFGIRAVASLTVVAGTMSVTVGQEALSLSMAGESAAHFRKLQREFQPFTTKLGDAEIRLGAGVSTEWNDNINLVERGSQTDVIVRPHLTTDVSWAITTVNSLEVNVTSGYAGYVEHHEYNRPYILPNSALSFDIFLKDVKVTLEDRLSYQQDSAERAVVAGTARFGGFDNVAGLNVAADLKDLNLFFSYHHRLFLSSVREFEYLDRSSHELFARQSVSLRPDLRLGIEEGFTPTAYSHSFLRDNLNYSAGTFAEWMVSKTLSINAHVGTVLYQYTGNHLPGAASGYSSYYFRVGVMNQIRKMLNHTLDVGQDTQLGVNNDLTRQLFVRYGINWMISRKVTATPSVTYEDGLQTGALLPESFSRLTFGTAMTWQWATRWNARLSWNFVSRRSDLPTRGYENHRVQLDVGYQH